MADIRQVGSKKSGMIWSITALVLAAGYVDLARGGDTLAPLLLVAGYGVLVPLAILS